VLGFLKLIKIKKNLVGGIHMNVLTLVSLVVVGYWVIGMTWIAKIPDSDWE